MNARDREFVERRAKFVRAWPWVGTLLLGCAAGLWVWLVATSPLLANPFHGVDRIGRGEVPGSTLALMAGMLPVAVTACLVVLVCAILFAFAAFSNERKYLAIIAREESRNGDGG